MNRYQLTYQTPSPSWIDGIPVGNGSTGAMYFGAPGREVFTLNHDRLWRKKYQKTIRSADIMQQLHDLILAGKSKQASAFFLESTKDVEPSINPYQLFANFVVTAPSENYNGYSCTLHMDTGIGESRYSLSGKEHHMEFFSPREEEAVCISYSSDEAMGRYAFAFIRDEDPECRCEVTFKDNLLTFKGHFVEGVDFAAVTAFELDEGTISWNGNSVQINGARCIRVIISLSTSFLYADPCEECMGIISRLTSRGYNSVRASHIEQFRQLMGNCTLQLEDSNHFETTEELYRQAVEDGYIPPLVYEQIFIMSRYLMYSASRKGSLPINLQGIWNDSIAPQWESGFTMDMNIQMQHWMALPCNIFEAQETVFDWIDANLSSLKSMAKTIFGAEGIYIPQYTDYNFTPNRDSCGDFQVLWTGAAAWMAHHYYEYWRYTGDKNFALQRAYPYMKLCADFYRSFLRKNEKGYYYTCPSCSPENQNIDHSWLVETATMDISLVQELMQHLIELNRQFSLHDPDEKVWKDILDNLVPYPIDSDNTLKEWVQDIDVLDPGHRHISHIYGLFPGKLFTREKTPELYQAAVNAIHKRIQNGYGSAATWSHAWYACCFARIGDGENAVKSIENIVKTGMVRNYLTTHNDWRGGDLSCTMLHYRLFQIDALLGACAAIAEMLIQCDDEGIRIFPSLPMQWKKGSACGLRAYGGFELAVSWNNGGIASLQIISHMGGKCKLLSHEISQYLVGIRDSSNCSIIFEKTSDGIAFDTVPGNRYDLIFDWSE